MPGHILHILWILFQVIVGSILVFPLVSYVWFLLVAKTSRAIGKPIENPDYGIIVTAYQFAGNLHHTIGSLLKLDYPQYIIYVVADNCADEEIFPEHEKVVILRPNPVLANQLKSHFLAINSFKRPHNIVTIIDSDNLVHPAYLSELNKWFDKGYQAVQGVRKAKNTNTEYASLDAVNELYYLFYDRKILFNIGSSCMLSGSGMAFTTSLYQQCLGNLDASGAGFDKILQKEILVRRNRIAFAEGAIVYDEKTASAEQLVKQRARWINTWFRFVKFGYLLTGLGIKNLNLNQFLSGFIMLRPPLFLLLVLSVFIAIVNLFINPVYSLVWAGLLGLFTLGFFIALANSETDKKLYASLKHIPKFMFLQLISLIKAKKANELSVSTEHSYHREMEEIKK